MNDIEKKVMSDLFNENDNLQKENAELKKLNDKLMKIAMGFPDAIGLPNIVHRTYFAIFEIMAMESQSDEKKLGLLMKYLRPSIEEDSEIVLSCIASIKKEHRNYSPILDGLADWIHDFSAY